MAAVAGRREHEPLMLDGEAHLSTTSEGELRIWWFRFSKTQLGLGYQSPRSRSYLERTAETGSIEPMLAALKTGSQVFAGPFQRIQLTARR